LNITHRVATSLLGGAICVRSPERRGTTFTLRIPQCAPALI
jgi:signal transduction histidine kinase